MKKLLCLMGGIITSTILNAAAISWTVDEAYTPEGATLDAGYYAYFIVSSGSFTGTDLTYALSDAVADLEKGDVSFVGTYALANASGDKGISFGGGAGLGSDLGDLSSNQTVEGYLVILDSSTVADATKAYLASTTELGETPSTTINGIGGSDPIAFGYLDASATASNWYTVGAPEPTSGLLLLLGLSGLALKRKNA